MTTIESTVLDVLRPGELLTIEQIAHSARSSKWRTRRSLNSLRRRGLCFETKSAQWQVSPLERRPYRRAAW